MKHLIQKEKNILHGTIGWSHNGNDGQYCEAGETVKIKWQPSAGWGLQEAHYTTETDPDTAVAIDLTQREFTMPADDITISGTFKKFVIGDWTSGTDAAENAGKVLGFDEDGNLVPVDNSVDGNAGNVIQSDGNGGIAANAKVNVNANGDVTADGDVTAGNNVTAKNVSANGNVTAVGNVSADGYLRLKDTVSGDYYKVEVTNGALVVTAL